MLSHLRFTIGCFISWFRVFRKQWNRKTKQDIFYEPTVKITTRSSATALHLQVIQFWQRGCLKEHVFYLIIFLLTVLKPRTKRESHVLTLLCAPNSGATVAAQWCTPTQSQSGKSTAWYSGTPKTTRSLSNMSRAWCPSLPLGTSAS